MGAGPSLSSVNTPQDEEMMDAPGLFGLENPCDKDRPDEDEDDSDDDDGNDEF